LVGAKVSSSRIRIVNVAVFRSCLSDRKHRAEIQNEMVVASSLQVNGTPSFLVGKMEGEEVSGTILVGAQPLSVFESKLRELEER
jgi:predicted DsbA family dithiol-disulfide isomerase